MWRAYTKEFRYNWHLAAPVILGMLGHVLVGLVDNIMVGQLGAAELAAVSLGNSFFFRSHGPWYWIFYGNHTLSGRITF
jgi:MATE family multidrug resistance protein